MTENAFDLIGADVLVPCRGLVRAPLSFAGGRIVDGPVGRAIDLSGCLVLPGIVDAHGDGFERHVAPRRGAVLDLSSGLTATAAELAANGITTAAVAQFWSWEGGMRSPEFAARLFAALAVVRDGLLLDLRPQLRLETHMTEDFADLPARLAAWGIGYVVFNDHLPHDRLDAGRQPPRLTGQALKAGRSPEGHLALMQALHRRGPDVPAALDRLCADLAGRGVLMGSHDDHTPEDRAAWRRRGVRISEFPETLTAAQSARAAGDAVVLGAPNVQRGGSHNGNVGARDLIARGLCDALASDYHYPGPRLAALQLARDGVLDFAAAWALVSSGPARMLGLTDRGVLEPGRRADLVVLDAATGLVGACIAGGCVAYMAGDVAARFLA